jgi:hypothetical protein
MISHRSYFCSNHTFIPGVMDAICFVLVSKPPLRLLYNVWNDVLKKGVRGGNPFFPWFMACSLTAVKKGHLVLNSSTTHGSRCTGNTFNTSLMTSDPSQCKLSNWRKCLCQAMLQCQMHFVSASPIAAVIPVLNVFFQCIHSMMCHHRYHK